MHPQAHSLWRGPRWTLALLLAGLSMLGPFAIDAYLPAFAGMAQDLGASDVQMQQTLSAYLIAFAVMNLFHGSLSDSLGRRPVVIAALLVFSVASAACAMSQSIGALIVFRTLQGMSAGGGMVVARAIVRDLFPPSQAQRVMSQITIFFGLAPALAPLLGGWLFVWWDWHAIFWGLCLLGAGLAVMMWRLLPESLHEEHRQPLGVSHLMRGYAQLLADPRFVALALTSGVSFNGMFIYVLASPAWLGQILGLAPTEFFWFFTVSVSGMMAGAWASGRMAGRISPARQIGWGMALMGAASAVNIVLNAMWGASVSWALLPVSAFSFGWSMMAPAVTLLLLDLFPERRGMASSLQSVIASTGNAVVAGLVVPAVMHAALPLALASGVMLLISALAWRWVVRRLPGVYAIAHGA